MLPVIVLSFISLFSATILALPTGVVAPGGVEARTIPHRGPPPFKHGRGNLIDVSTPNKGVLKGVDLGNGAARFVVKYANAPRFQPSVKTNQWVY
jgi:hypothetical protein